MSKVYKMQFKTSVKLTDKIVDLIKPLIIKALKEFGEETAQRLAILAKKEVYGAYDLVENSKYVRRWTLIDPDNYEVSIDEKNMRVSITPIASFNRANGGWNFGNELGGFMNFGDRWHDYVINYSVTMPRPYLSNYVNNAEVRDSLYSKLQAALGDLIDVLDIRISLGDD